jgi:hypothetical protein
MALQEDWRWCGVCEGIVYAAFGNGVCFDENPHQLGNSGYYGVGFDAAPPAAQGNWLWCARCQGLYFDDDKGRCFDGEPHDPNGSRAYWVHLDSVPQGAQEDWRLCNRCSRLIYVGFGDGFCWDGAEHDVSQSGAYSVDVVPPPRLSLTVVEQGSHIDVSGAHFTPGEAVALAFVRGSSVKKVPLRADADGRFEYVERNARPSGGSGIVIARDDSIPDFAVAGLERLFPYVRESVIIDPGTELVPE